MDDLVIGVSRNVLTVGGREFVILPPTPRDMIATAQRMRELAQAQYRSPVDYALSHGHLPPAALALEGLAVTTEQYLVAGIVPDLVLTVDPQDVRYHFAGCDLSRTCLVTAATAHPALPAPTTT